MRINADFDRLALVIPRDDDWVCSPESGVDRLMLDRIGTEVARATSIVRYAAGSSFSSHLHAKGEEFLVLDGVFSDENGDYPPGTYVRNPPGSRHAPRSENGCRILVKLRQFDRNDLMPVVIDTNDGSLWQDAGDATLRLALHNFGTEQVEMRRVSAGKEFVLDGEAGGAELLVVSGTLWFGPTRLRDECWLRLPQGGSEALLAEQDTIAWIKTGHLPPDL
ncbi:MAG: cupin domain-containing protein [Gammaproteobacteria bacterium]|jgi:hypothetical protein|nr:cupin domain-containing protein [Gammaproteobacteria bacterium]